MTAPKNSVTRWNSSEDGEVARTPNVRGVEPYPELKEMLKPYGLTQDEYSVVEALARYRYQSDARRALGVGQQVLLTCLRSAYPKLGVDGHKGLFRLLRRLRLEL